MSDSKTFLLRIDTRIMRGIKQIALDKDTNVSRIIRDIISTYVSINNNKENNSNVI